MLRSVLCSVESWRKLCDLVGFGAAFIKVHLSVGGSESRKESTIAVSEHNATGNNVHTTGSGQTR